MHGASVTAPGSMPPAVASESVSSLQASTIEPAATLCRITSLAAGWQPTTRTRSPRACFNTWVWCFCERAGVCGEVLGGARQCYQHKQCAAARCSDLAARAYRTEAHCRHAADEAAAAHWDVHNQLGAATTGRRCSAAAAGPSFRCRRLRACAHAATAAGRHCCLLFCQLLQDLNSHRPLACHDLHMWAERCTLV